MVVWQIALLHIKGEGYERDITKGINILLEEVEAGNIRLKAFWAMLLMQGTFVERNETEAFSRPWVGSVNLG